MPPIDKIHEVLDDVWDILFGFLSPELLLDIPMMDERAIEEFEKWSDDENEGVSSKLTTSTSEEAALVPVTLTHFRMVTNAQLKIAVKKRISRKRVPIGE